MKPASRGSPRHWTREIPRYVANAQRVVVVVVLVLVLALLAVMIVRLIDP